MSDAAPTTASPQFIHAMPHIARQLLGEPNPSLSNRSELRFGSRGSMSIDLSKGTWFDHEADKGGGALDLVMRQKRIDKAAAIEWMAQHGHIEKSPGTPPGGFKIIKAYDYTDESGVVLFQVCRLDPKDFRQRRPDSSGAGGWSWGTKGIRRVLYRLPGLIEAVAQHRTIYIVEGEKSADTLAALGLAATCSPGGAGKWRREYSDALAGADVVVLPDNDEPGSNHAADVVRHLAPIAVRCVRLDLPGLPPKGDVVDWLEAGNSAADLIALARNTKPAPDTAAPVPRGAQDEIDAAIDAVVRRFNARYLVVHEGGKTVILEPYTDPVLKRRHFNRLTFRDLAQLYMNDLVKVGMDKEGNAIWKNAADVWLRHRQRRTYVGGVTFDPSGKAPAPDTLNLWEGYAVTPAPGDWSLLRSHIETIICDGDKERFSYLMGWMARLLQRPAEQGETAVVMKGKEGTGKGTLAKVLMRITGHHGLAISNAKHLIGNFNGHLRDVVFLFADEALFAGDRAHVGVLKSLITEPYLTVEAKFANAVQSPNFLHVMMASNEEWVVPASLEARRFFVLTLPDAAIGDHAYFGAIWEQMERGGYEAMLHDLLRHDLSTFNVRAVPNTAGLEQQRKLSLPAPDAWWLDCLERGYIFRSKLGLEDEFSRWHSSVTTELLFASYTEFSERQRERRRMTREALGKFIRGMGGEPRRLRSKPTGEHMTNDTSGFGTARIAKPIAEPRPHGFDLGDLAAARAAFTEATGLSVEWDDSSLDETNEP